VKNMTARLGKLTRGIVRLAALYLSAVPSLWMVANPLLYIMFLPLGIHYVMTLPWPFLKDLPDPFGRGMTLYFLSHVYSALTMSEASALWNAVEDVLMLSGLSLFLLSFVWWLRSRGKLMAAGPYRLVRHPQYLGLIITILGLSLRAARPIALISWGTMTYAYVLIAYLEEQSLAKRLGKEYMDYRARTSFMLPAPRIRGKEPINVGRGPVVLTATLGLILYILIIIYVSPWLVFSLRSTTY